MRTAEVPNPEIELQEGSDQKGERVRSTQEALDAISQLRKPMESILERLREKINNHEFGLIIGEDASGRGPALVMDRFFRTLGGEKPKTIFLAGSSMLNDNEIEPKTNLVNEYFEKFFSENPMTEGKKALIVTDTIVTGRGLTPIIHALRRQHVDYEIITISDNSPGFDEVMRRSGEKPWKPWMSAQEGNHPIYGAKEVSGVRKDPIDLHSKVISESSNNLRESVVKSREAITQLGIELATWFTQSNPSKVSSEGAVDAKYEEVKK